MVQIFLVRHGQANSEAKDEISYDKLSSLGKLQAGWLGQYLKKNKFTFDVCFSGTLFRQRDTADLLETLNSEDRKKVVNFLEEKFPSETLPATNVPILIDIIEEFEINHFIKMLSELDTDDITYVLEICEDDLRKKVLKSLPKDLQKLIKKSLNYDEDSAGRIMQTDYVSIPLSWNIGQVVDYLRMSKRIPDEFYALFAVDSRHIPVGTVPLYTAMRKKREIKI